MKLYVLEWVSTDEWDYTSGVVGVYSSQAAAEESWNSCYYGGNEYYDSVLTEVFLDKEVV